VQHHRGVIRSSRLLWTTAIVLIALTLLACAVAIWDLRRQTIE
jgi:hypothetical protein